MKYIEVLKSFFETFAGFWVGIVVLYLLIWSVWIWWQFKIADTYYYENGNLMRKIVDRCQIDGCKCKASALQKETRQCEICDEYIDRVDHIILSDNKNK